MIEFGTETLIRLWEIPKLLPPLRVGKMVNPATIYRWTTVGCRGVVLESVQIGGVRCTSKEALQRFFANLTAKANDRAKDAAQKTSCQATADRVAAGNAVAAGAGRGDAAII